MDTQIIILLSVLGVVAISLISFIVIVSIRTTRKSKQVQPLLGVVLPIDKDNN
jgi:hypothetical protein